MVRMRVSCVSPEVILSCEAWLLPFVELAVWQRTFVTPVGIAFCKVTLKVFASQEPWLV
jgi:hypothetical protein